MATRGISRMGRGCLAIFVCLVGCSDPQPVHPPKKVAELDPQTVTATQDAAPRHTPTIASQEFPPDVPPGIAPARANQLTVVVSNDMLRATDGNQMAPLSIIASEITKLTRSPDGRMISVDYHWLSACAPEVKRRQFSVASLEARLLNKQALKRHRQKEYRTAAEGFARAVALDPDYEQARTNLACAQTLLNQRSAALATLAPLLKENPARIYLKILTDDDYLGIRTEPAINALKSPVPGTARLVDRVEKFTVAYSAAKQLFASISVARSWGSLEWSACLNVHDAKTGRFLFDHVVVDWGDTPADGEGGGRYLRPKQVSQRRKALNQFLADFGFNVPQSLHIGSPIEEHANGWPTKVKFKTQKLSLVLKNNIARVIRQNKILARQKPAGGQMIERAFYLSQPPTAIYFWQIDEPEGCGIEAPVSGVEVIPLTRTGF